MKVEVKERQIEKVQTATEEVVILEMNRTEATTLRSLLGYVSGSETSSWRRDTANIGFALDGAGIEFTYRFTGGITGKRLS
ncbi:hypothetical protein [Herbidospora cretacea]|uniref:hypothetical protein n=1 Tax=Herbidospora cretacea TaxID=28444 RepID=UPI000774D303|nr:hypothetical protein [Herbidospora cretacea]